MAEVNSLMRFHLLEIFQSLRPWASSVIETHKQLSDEQRRNLAGHALQLGEYVREMGQAVPETLLLELACLIPGDRVGKPEFQANQAPDQRRLSANDLRVAAGWLQQVDRTIATFKSLSPELRQLAFGAVSPPETESLTTLEVITRIENQIQTGLWEMSPDSWKQGIAEYRSLSKEEGRHLARFALDLLDSNPTEEEVVNVVVDIVSRLTCLVPGSIDGLQADLARRGVTYPGAIFWRAGSDARNALLEQLDASASDAGEINSTLIALAWIGDQEVQSQFRHWRETPPAWRSLLNVPPDSYALEAGWELTENGARRNLAHLECYGLVPADELGGNTDGPVQVVTPHEGACGWCGRSLVTMFDLELSDSRLQFLGLKGDRLRIAICERCTSFAILFTDIDTLGKSEWSSVNTKPDYNGDDEYYKNPENEEYISFPQRRLFLAERQRGPFEAFVLEERQSQLGGYPAWLQDAEYPPCPKCQAAMLFVGQLLGSDLDSGAPGITYAFACTECQLATTTYQQT